MKKNSLASLELAAIINELQFLKNGKISQIYHQNEELLLQLHTPSLRKQFLKIIPGKLLCLTINKNPPLRPSGFCMQLRKYLDNAVITDLYQKDAQRIVVLELEKKEAYFLIIELFSKGNIILTNHAFNIIGVLQPQIWKDRVVKAKQDYVFPLPGVNWKGLKLAEFEKIIKISDKKNIATTLATELNLGGVYAEEICAMAGVDKNLLATNLTLMQCQLLYSELKEALRKILHPQGFIYVEQITPFKLAGPEPITVTKTYNEAIDSLNPFQRTTPLERKINTINRRIIEQEDVIKSLGQKITVAQRSGELIYENYTSLKTLLQLVAELKVNHNWIEMMDELKRQNRITQFNLKHKTVVVNLS